MTLMRECDNCKCPDERVFRDSFTGMELCVPCLSEVINKISLSPGTEGDNLKTLLQEEGSTYQENDNDDVHVDVLKSVRSSPYNDPNR